MRELKGTIIYTLSSLAIKFGGIIILPILTRLLTPEEYGVIGYVSPIYLILSLFIGGGLYAPLMKKYSDYKKDNNFNNFGSYAFSFILFISFVFILFLVFFSIPTIKSLIISFIPNGIKYRFIYYSICISYLSALNSFYLSFFRIKDKYKIIAISSLLAFVIQYTITISLLLFTSFGVSCYFIGLLFSNFCVLILLGKSFFKYLNFKLSIDKVKYGIRNGIPMIFIELGDRLAEISDRFILAKFLSLSSVGVYSLAITGGKIIQVLGSSYTNTLISELYDNKKPQQLIKKIEGFYLLLILVGIIIQLLSFNIINMIFPSSYTNLNNYFILLIPCSLIQYFYFLDFYFHSNERSKFIPIITTCVILLNLVLNLLFIPMFGVYAAILSTYLVFLFRLIIQVRLIRVKFNVSFNLKKITIIGSVLFIIPLINEFVKLNSFFMERLIFSIIFSVMFFFFSYVHFKSNE